MPCTKSPASDAFTQYDHLLFEEASAMTDRINQSRSIQVSLANEKNSCAIQDAQSDAEKQTDPYPGRPTAPGNVAEWLNVNPSVHDHKSQSSCHILPSSPSVGDINSLCTTKYSQLTKRPAISDIKDR